MLQNPHEHWGYNFCDLLFERVFVIQKWNSKLMFLFWVCLFYDILVNAFYFHEYLYTFKLVKCDLM